MRGRSKSCAVRPREQGRHAVSEIRRAVSMEVAVKESKRGNIAAMRKGLKTVSQRKGVDKTKSFRFHPVQKSCMSGASTNM